MPSGDTESPDDRGRYDYFLRKSPLSLALLLCVSLMMIWFAVSSRNLIPVFFALMVLVSSIWSATFLLGRKPLLSFDRDTIRLEGFLIPRTLSRAAVAAMTLRRKRTEMGNERFALDFLPLPHPTPFFLGGPRILMSAGGFALIPGGWMFTIDLPRDEDQLWELLGARDRLAPSGTLRNWSWSEDGRKVEIHPPG